MAKIFLSHSSKDQETVATIASALHDLGHTVWLDKWEMRVGDCIPTKIEQGIDEADFVVVALSRAAVASGWVDREWKAKYWSEVSAKRVMVLPVRLEPLSESEMPALLRTKRYADFTKNFITGMLELADGIDRERPLRPAAALAPANGIDRQITAYLSRLGDPSARLSSVIPEIMEFANRMGNTELADACRCHLVGPTVVGIDDVKNGPSYAQVRVIKVFVGIKGEINTRYLGWADNPEAMFQYMEKSDDFRLFPLSINFALTDIEALATQRTPTSILKYDLRIGDVAPDAKNPDRTLPSYARGNSFPRILEAIRSDLLVRLTTLLPRVATALPLGPVDQVQRADLRQVVR